MNLSQIENLVTNAKQIFFIGIGGISMSSLAVITKNNGKDVKGSDRTESALTQKMEICGIEISYEHKAENVHGASLVVYTAAVSDTNPEMLEADRLGIPKLSRAEYLGYLMSSYKNRIGVSGTHGKSSVTSMLAEIYMAGGYDPTVVSGAELSSIGGAYRIGNNENFIFEACEYCDSFLSFYPTTAVVTNVEYDHADYFRDMEQMRESFRKYVNIAQNAVLNADDPETLDLRKHFNGKAVTFSIKGNGDYNAENIVYKNGCASFDIVKDNETLCAVTLRVVGEHNVKNALCAAAAAFENGVDSKAVRDGLNAFKGAKRRFEYMGKTESGAEVYNDYAHHPSELKAVLGAAKALNKRIISVFQPHTYSRTASLFCDFVQSFENSDITVFADIYAARETDTLGMSAQLLAQKTPRSIYVGSNENIAEYLKKSAGRNDIVLILGAGDIVKLGNMIVK